MYPGQKLADRSCRNCGEKYVPTSGNQKFCESCSKTVRRAANNAAGRAYRKKARIQNRERRLQKEFGVGQKEYEAMLKAQGGGCAICGNKPRKKSLDIDHDHETGLVRGVLCHQCNKTLGMWRENPARFRKAAEYIETRGVWVLYGKQLVKSLEKSRGRMRGDPKPKRKRAKRARKK